VTTDMVITQEKTFVQFAPLCRFRTDAYAKVP
jgi:hypothetical protein